MELYGTMCGMMIAMWFLYYPIYYIYIEYFQYSIVFYMYNVVGNDSQRYISKYSIGTMHGICLFWSCSIITLWLANIFSAGFSFYWMVPNNHIQWLTVKFIDKAILPGNMQMRPIARKAIYRHNNNINEAI